MHQHCVGQSDGGYMYSNELPHDRIAHRRKAEGTHLDSCVVAKWVHVISMPRVMNGLP